MNHFNQTTIWDLSPIKRGGFLSDNFRFFLGVHNASWLHTRPVDREIPLFLSRNRMPKGGISRKAFIRATTDWALDSGAFTELKDHGRWRMSAVEYAQLCNRYEKYIGRLQWVSPQDWMCEPIVIEGGIAPGQGPVKDRTFVGTKLSVREHQERTVENFLELRRLCVPWVIPVVQGFTISEYMDCLEMYEMAGVELKKEPVVGIGSVCRRQGTDEIASLFRLFSSMGIRCHGFGVKTSGLALSIEDLESADSLAWSIDAKHKKTHRLGTSCGKLTTRGKNKGNPIKNCANCFHAAVEWFDELMESLKESDV